MARATFVQKAQKDYPEHGIKKGESYYWWKFAYGQKQFSKTPPKASQLTQSAYLSQAYAVEEAIGNLSPSANLESDVADIISTLRDMASECEDNRSNMPDALQDSETGELLERRAQACNDYADELEALDLSDEFTPDEDDEEKEERDDPVNSDGETEEEYWQSKLDEVTSCSFEIE